jgi:hypothetical protein
MRRGREDGEVDGVFLGRGEFHRLTRVDACHRERLAGLQRDAVGLLAAVGHCSPFVVAVVMVRL